VLAVLGLAGLYRLAPISPSGPAPAPASAGELKALVASLAAVPPRASGDRERAALGRRLYADARLGGNGKACGSCHDPRHRYGGPGVPSLVNSYMTEWFYGDGRSDSLAAAALAAIEDPRQAAGSRLAAVILVRDHYLRRYVEVFGPLPASVRAALPAAGLPAPPALALATPLAAAALASIGSYPLLEEILDAAQTARRAPAAEVSRRAFAVARAPALPPLKSWNEAWASLPPATQADVDRVYANVGLALAAYARGLVAVASPFDRFAARLLAGAEPRAAMDTAFGDQELAGLAVYAGAGRCADCHGGPAFTDHEFHNLGLAQRGPALELGRTAGVIRVLADPFNGLGVLLPCGTAAREACRELPFLTTAAPELIGAFKTPSLRNVALVPRFMHDGRFTSLTEVVRYFDTLDEGPAAIGRREGSLTPLDLSEAQIQALTAFLRALTSPVRDLNAAQAAKAGS
jgi:cytochrome c peroxidase